MSEQIFISYRRSGGDLAARSMRERLIREGYTVFYDRDSLHKGYFDTRILSAIENCRDFLLILPPHALDRCNEPDDWVRKEIECAIDSGANIIPILMPGFTFPKELPESIAVVSRLQGVAFNECYFDAMIQLLVNDRLESKPRLNFTAEGDGKLNAIFKKILQNKKFIVICTIFLIAITTLVCLFSFSKFGRQLLCSHSFENTITEPTCTTSGLNYLLCIKCGYHEEKKLPALNHSFVNWAIDKEASESEPGYKHSICEKCGERKDTTYYLNASEGLEYEKIGDHYVLVGIGSCPNEKIIIPPTIDGYPVTEIGANAFKNNQVITSIIIPENVKIIKSEAFFSCLNLKEVNFPQSLTVIENNAFFGCNELKSIIIPESVTEIGEQAFASCRSLKNIYLPTGIEKIGLWCFFDSWNMESLNYGGTVEEWRNRFKFRIDLLFLAPNFDIYCTDATFTIAEDLISIFKK